MYVLYYCAFIAKKNFLCNFCNYTISNSFLFLPCYLLYISCYLFSFFLSSLPYSLSRAIKSTSQRHRIEITVTLLAVLLAVSWIPVSIVTVNSNLCCNLLHTTPSFLSYLLLIFFFIIYNHYYFLSTYFVIVLLTLFSISSQSVQIYIIIF